MWEWTLHLNLFCVGGNSCKVIRTIYGWWICEEKLCSKRQQLFKPSVCLQTHWMIASATWLGIYTVSIKNTQKSYGIFSFRLWEYRHYKYCPALCFYSRFTEDFQIVQELHYLVPIKKGGDTILSWIGNFFLQAWIALGGKSCLVCKDGTFTVCGKKDDAAELKKKKGQNSKDWLVSFASIPYFITKECGFKVHRCTIHWTL